MCDPTTMLVSSAISGGAKIYGGIAKKRAAYANAAEYEYQAAVARDNAQAEAAQIRRAGERARGETLAGFAAAGVKIGEWSALEVEREVMIDAKRDEFMTILNGERMAGSLERKASATRRAGRDAALSGLLKGGGTLLKAGMDYAGWRSAGPGFAGTQAPAPVETRYPSFR